MCLCLDRILRVSGRLHTFSKMLSQTFSKNLPIQPKHWMPLFKEITRNYSRSICVRSITENYSEYSNLRANIENAKIKFLATRINRKLCKNLLKFDELNTEKKAQSKIYKYKNISRFSHSSSKSGNIAEIDEINFAPNNFEKKSPLLLADTHETSQKSIFFKTRIDLSCI